VQEKLPSNTFFSYNSCGQFIF